LQGFSENVSTSLASDAVGDCAAPLWA
jgi:hypothetical protein